MNDVERDQPVTKATLSFTLNTSLNWKSALLCDLGLSEAILNSPLISALAENCRVICWIRLVVFPCDDVGTEHLEEFMQRQRALMDVPQE